MQKHIELAPSIPPVCRLGLATPGNTNTQSDDVLYALERGINYWNWCGHDDGMIQAVRQLGPRRGNIVRAAQRSAGFSECTRATTPSVKQLEHQQYRVIMAFSFTWAAS